MDKIAIVGLGCLLPKAHNPEEFWQNLIEEIDSTSLATVKEMGVDPQIYYDPVQGRRDKYYWMRGGYVRDFTFDPTGYRLPPEELDALDNMFKWSLYVARQALEDSGYLHNEQALEQCGVILGNLSFPTRASHRIVLPIYQQALEETLGELLEEPAFHLERLSEVGVAGSSAAEGSANLDADAANLLISGYPAGIVAQALALQGGHFAMDAACATSLYAVKLACHYLIAGKTDMMLAGAVSGADPFHVHMGFSIFQAYPQEGSDSRPLDKRSRGLRSAEGAGMLVLKRYEDALRDGDKIYAIIRGAGLSNDGRGKHALTPNPKGQRLAFERAYAEAGVLPHRVDYVECHATGTPLGDVTELNSMEAFFGEKTRQAGVPMPLVGSVKSNFGHLLTAAGMAGIIKTVLGMNRGIIPATIRIQEPLSSQGEMIIGTQIVRSATDWPTRTQSNGEKTRLAGVTAFGFGGTNAHLILEGRTEETTEVVTTIGGAYATTAAPRPDVPLAIVGMDAFFGLCEGLEAFHRTLYDGQQHFIPLPETRWKGIEADGDLLKAYGFEDGTPPKGAYIEGFEMDFLYFKTPPSPGDQPIPQHLLMLKVADNAIKDAGLQEGGNVAVIIAMGMDLVLHQFRGRVDLTWQIKAALTKAGIHLSAEEESALEEMTKDILHHPAKVNQYTSFIGNIIATRISALWDFVGPSFTLSIEENSLWGALEVAQVLLATDEVEAVVVGAVDLSGGIEHVLLRHRIINSNRGVATLSYDRDADGWMVGEGAGAVVLKRHEQAIAQEDRIYAVIDALATASSPASDAQLNRAGGGLGTLQIAPTAETITRASREALANANISANEIDYLEVCASGIAHEDEAEIEGVLAAYGNEPSELNVALGSVKANIGHTYCASGMASLIKTALCLYHRFIPATPNWSGPKNPALWENSPFYVPTTSRPWFMPDAASINIPAGSASDGKRFAAISGLGQDGMAAHLILTDACHPNESTYHHAEDLYLFPLAADERAELLAQLDRLEQMIESGQPFSAIASAFFADFQARPEATYVLSMCGAPDELPKEISRARKGVARAFDDGKDWQTPRGSCFTATPLGTSPLELGGTEGGQVAFVYPGAFNSYIGLGQDLFELSPLLHDRLAKLTANLSSTTGERRIYPRSMSHLSRDEITQLEKELVEDAITMSESGLIFATTTTSVLRDDFGIEPAAAFGYSLGEGSMMWALGVWTAADEGSEGLRNSQLFNTRLSGPKNAIYEYWQRHSQLPANSEEGLSWHTYVLMSPAKKVQPYVDEEPLAYLTIINSPKEVVIAGDGDACQRVIKKVGGHSLRAPFDHVLHCEPMASEYDEFVRLHHFPVNELLFSGEKKLPTLYSASEYKTISLSPEGLGHHVAQVCCQQLDFPRLVNQAYDDGARIFIELGASRTCSRWIKAILKKQPHLALSIDKKGVDNRTSIVRALAKLLTHRVPMDLSPLYLDRKQPESESNSKHTLIRRVLTGGARISDFLLSEENRERFREALKASPVTAATTNGTSSAPVPPQAPPLSQESARSALAPAPAPTPTPSPSPAPSPSPSPALPPQPSTPTGHNGRSAIQIPPIRLQSGLSSPQIKPIDSHSLPPALTTPSSSQAGADGTSRDAYATYAETDHAPAVAAPISTTKIEFPTHSTSERELMDNVQLTRSDASALHQPPTDGDGDNQAIFVASAATFAWAQWQGLQLQMLTELENSQRASKGHQLFLQNRQAGIQQLSGLIESQMTLLEQLLSSESVEKAEGETQEGGQAGTWQEGEINTPEPSLLTQMPADEALGRNKEQSNRADKREADEPVSASERVIRAPSAASRLPQAPPSTQLPAQMLLTMPLQKVKVEQAPPAVSLPVPTLKQAPSAASLPVPKVKQAPPAASLPVPKEVIWDEADLLEFAEGKIGNVFGPEYSIIDNYSRRVRLPTPPYLLVSRVTKLSATRGRFEPCSLTTEYDIPHDAWYLVDGQIPWAVAVESGQCDLLLISYLGIDFECKGELVYRLLDATLTFMDEIPMAGDTLRYDISINSYARSGANLLFFFSYNCYVGDKIVLKMRNGCAGFFSDQELAEGQGVIFSDSEEEAFRNVEPQHVEPLLKSNKHAFEYADLLLASEGHIAQAFGTPYDQAGLNPSLRLPPPDMLMMDRIVSIDPHGGRWGLGLVMAEKDLAPDHWYFPCHFMDDQVLAGSLMADGCVQLMQFYMLYLGMQTETVDARFHPLHNLPQAVRCRGQVTPINRKMTYKMEITEIGLTPTPYAKANVSIFVDGKFAVYFDNLGLVLLEKHADDPFKIPSTSSGSVPSTVPALVPVPEPVEGSSGTVASTGVSLRDVNGQPITVRKAALFNEADIEAFAKGSIVACFGEEYAIYEDQRSPRTPNGPLKLVSRITEVNGQRHHVVGGSSLVSEYDVPANAWFYQENNYPTMPYSIIMEIALQPCGFLSAYLGSTLPYPEIDFYFRNLDGQGKLLKDGSHGGVIDLHGKTITNRVSMVSSTAIQGIIIQKFEYEMLADGEAFYKGDAAFGYFTKEALSDQVGLDSGKFVPPWYETAEGNLDHQAIKIDLRTADAQALYRVQAGKAHYRLADPSQRLNLLDEVLIVPGGGVQQKGYVYGEKAIDLNDWFFRAHFHQDPVMPGSLGVEAIIQAMQAYAIQQELASDFQSPYFEQVADHNTKWRYRGQIPHTNLRMRIEINFTNIEKTADRVTLYGDASLWRDKLRIYEVKQIALNILEG